MDGPQSPRADGPVDRSRPAARRRPVLPARQTNAARFAETGVDLESALGQALASADHGVPSSAELRRRKNLGGRPPLEPGSETTTWKVKAPASLNAAAREAGASYSGGFSAFVRDAVRDKLAARGAATPAD